MDKLELGYMQTVLPKQYRKLINQDTVDEINNLVDDPDYGEQYKDSIITYSSILEGKDKWSLRQYIDAVKFYSLTAAQDSQVAAYIKVFPERLQARLNRGEKKDDMRGEASRFNSSDLVNKIRSQALIPLHLINQGNLQLGINTLADICTNSNSDVARASAATSLLKELRPPETQQVELQLGLSDEARLAQEKQSILLTDIAKNQRELMKAGHSISDIQKMHVTHKTIDVEISDV